jgi:hypothetical protein
VNGVNDVNARSRVAASPSCRRIEAPAPEQTGTSKAQGQRDTQPLPPRYRQLQTRDLNTVDCRETWFGPSAMFGDEPRPAEPLPPEAAHSRGRGFHASFTRDDAPERATNGGIVISMAGFRACHCSCERRAVSAGYGPFGPGRDDASRRGTKGGIVGAVGAHRGTSPRVNVTNLVSGTADATMPPTWGSEAPSMLTEIALVMP